jgi:hypothetical protein
MQLIMPEEPGDIALLRKNDAGDSKRSHPDVDTVDCLIAATAELNGAALCTSNLKHFPMFKNLKPAYRRWAAYDLISGARTSASVGEPASSSS